MEEYKENKKKLDNEEKQLKEQLKELNYKEKQEVRKEKTYELCKTAYEILSDEETSFELKDESYSNIKLVLLFSIDLLKFLLFIIQE